MLGLHAAGIEVAVSSAQITGAIGTLFLMLIALIGWLVRAEWRAVNTRLERIEANTSDLPALKARVSQLEEGAKALRIELAILRARQHRIANFVNRLLGKLDRDNTEILDLEKED